MKKKRNLITLCALGFCMALTSCFENTGEHFTKIYYPENGRKTIYADQTEDSLVFVTFDSWKMDTLYYNTPENQKLKVTLNNPEDMAGTVPAGKYMRRCVQFKFSPNTADTIRAVAFNINAYNNDFGAVYQQVHYHNIERPLRTKDTYEFLLTDTAEAVLDSVVFVAYDDWTLKVKKEEQNNWISVATPSGKKGKQIVRLNLQKNKGNDKRSATLILTSSNSATTEIRLVQDKVVAKP